MRYHFDRELGDFSRVYSDSVRKITTGIFKILLLITGRNKVTIMDKITKQFRRLARVG